MAGLAFLILAGAAVTAAAPVEGNKWFTSQESPKTALLVGERGAIAYTIDVAPDGTAIRCTPKDDGDLDRKVCELVMKKARFLPAKDDQGRAVYALHDGVSSFLMPGKGNGRPERAKLIVAVEALPEGVVSPAYAKVAFLVDSAGAISQCASAPGERRRFLQTYEALGPAACERLAQEYRPTPARNEAGAAVPSVQTVMVRFETK